MEAERHKHCLQMLALTYDKEREPGSYHGVRIFFHGGRSLSAANS